MTCAGCGHNRAEHRLEQDPFRGGWDTSCRHQYYKGPELVKCSCPEYVESTADSRLKRLLACLDDIRTAAREAETVEVRRLADELPASDAKVFLLRMAARFCDTTLAGANQLLTQLDSTQSGTA